MCISAHISPYVVTCCSNLLHFVHVFLRQFIRGNLRHFCDDPGFSTETPSRGDAPHLPRACDVLA